MIMNGEEDFERGGLSLLKAIFAEFAWRHVKKLRNTY
jgi:hypothetical protein